MGIFSSKSTGHSKQAPRRLLLEQPRYPSCESLLVGQLSKPYRSRAESFIPITGEHQSTFSKFEMQRTSPIQLNYAKGKLAKIGPKSAREIDDILWYFTGEDRPSTDNDEAQLPSAGGSTRSNSKVAIKLSAEYLILPRYLRERYLMKSIPSEFKRSGIVEFHLDLTELDLELTKEVPMQASRFPEESEFLNHFIRRRRHAVPMQASRFPEESKFPLLPFIRRRQRHAVPICSLIIAQIDHEGNNKVCDRTIKTFSETFNHLNELFHINGVDVSKCTVPNQVLLLPGLLSAHEMESSSMKVICTFCNDIMHLEKDEVKYLLKLTKPLVVKGVLSDYEFGNLTTKLFKNNIRNENVISKLTKAGAEVNITDKDGKTALFYAVQYRYSEKVTLALIAAGADVNRTDKDGKTPLFYAVQYRYSEKVTHALIAAGADVNRTDKDGKTSLFYVDYSTKATLALTKAGADVNRTDQDGKTPLFYAVCNDKVTHALIAAGADVNRTDKDGKTALFYAVDNGKVAHALIAAGADVNRTDEDGKTPLFYAVQYMYSEKVTHALIAAGADVNRTDKDGKIALFYAVDNEKVARALIEAGADVNITDWYGETVLLSVLGKGGSILQKCLHSNSKAFFSLIEVLLENGASLCEATEEEDSVFHLIMKLFQQTILSSADKEKKWSIMQEVLDILKLFSQTNECDVAVNKRDIDLNSPLHQWATLSLASSDKYHENICDDYDFKKLLYNILEFLLKCGVKVDDGNEKKQTPLHMCRTWTAVKLLLGAGAEPDVKDSSGCTPLLAAAKRNTCIKKHSKFFYPDVTQTPNVFWKEVLEKNLDPWTADKNGNSVLRILVQQGAESLAKAFVEVACELNGVQSDEIGVRLLITVCRDKSPDKEWKVDLVKTLLKYRNSLAQESLSNKDTALHFCCRNMLELPEESVKTSVHWKIAQHLILCGADVRTTGKDGKSCLDIAESCPVLKDLLSMPVNVEEVPPLIDSWKPVSRRHRKQLEEVSRCFSCQHIEKVCYSKEALDNGTFGLVFVGIRLQDGKEIAVKRIETVRIDNKESLKEEVEDLKLSMKCDNVIQCLMCTFDKDFLYVILELMEGNLDCLFSDEYSFDINQKAKLCRDICTGLAYLHNHHRNIIHRGIKPKNILYQVLPSGIIHLKLAFFGLRSQRCKEQQISDFRNTHESLTKERCWMAPEVLQSQSHSKSSDVFSCGLVIYYLLTNKKHPFAPGGSSRDSPLKVSIETVDNIAHNRIELDETISSDAKDLVKRMLDHDSFNRISISNALEHSFFQSKPENFDH